MTYDPKALPLSGAVLDLTEGADGRVRVTFRQLASIYWVEKAAPDRDRLLEALRRSQRTGERLELKYALPTKSLAS